MKKKYILILITSLYYSSVNAQWVKTNGPEGICITSFFNEDSLLLCGTYAQGVFRSYDNGSTWVVSNQGLQNKWIDCFAKDSAYLYAGSFAEGVFRSSDYGYTWQPANAGIQNQAIVCLLNEGGNLFAGTVSNGIFLSTNHGNSWIDINGGALSSSYIHAMVYSAPRLMVEADNYIFYSLDTGITWNVDQGTTQFYVINSFFRQGDTILAAAGNNLFRTTDGGINWSSPYQVSTPVAGFDRMSDTVFAGTGFGLLYSIDWGFSWVPVTATGLRSGASAFVISGNNCLLGREEIGVAVTSDKGSTWTQIPPAYFNRASTIDNSMFCANGIVYSGTHGNGVFETPDQGNTWNKIGTTNQFDTLSNEVIFSILHVQPDILLAGGCGTGLFRSADNGVTWNHITAGLPPASGTFTCVKTLAQCGSNILAALTNGVFYSSDNGLTWNATNLTGTNIEQAGGFAIRGNIACTGIIAFPSPPIGIYRSTDYGVTWFLADAITDIEVMATGGNHTMYCGELFTSYVSYDDGITWQGNGIGGAFTILAWDNFAFIGNNTGVLFSNNYGFSWSQVNQGMDPYPNNSVQGLTCDSVYVYAGTFRDAVWRRPLSDFGITTSITESAYNSERISVAPNPASAFIKINLPPSVKGKYSLSVFNASGQNILLNEINSVDKNNSLSVYVKDFYPGFYTISVEINGRIFSTVFIKN